MVSKERCIESFEALLAMFANSFSSADEAAERKRIESADERELYRMTNSNEATLRMKRGA